MATTQTKIKLVKPTEFTISLRRWLRGEGGSGSRLRRAIDSKKCCVGFYALACGVNAKKLTGLCEARELLGETGLELPGMLKNVYGQMDDTHIAGELYSVNDNRDSTDEEKITAITKLFRRIGVAVKFVK